MRLSECPFGGDLMVSLSKQKNRQNSRKVLKEESRKRKIKVDTNKTKVQTKYLNNERIEQIEY